VITKVLIADDQSMVRHGFRMIIETEPDMQVVAEAPDGQQALSACRRFAPDVVLMDIRMPVLDGLDAARRILAEDGGPRVIMLTTFDLDEYVYESLCAGASGFLLKNSPPEQLVQAIRVVARGEALLDPGITRRVIERFAASSPGVQSPSEMEKLTPREREVLLLVARGLSNAEIAARLVVAPGTVKTHVASVLAKLGLRDRTQAVVLAYEHGLVRPGGAPGDSFPEK
jgi:DNA-binding NarL/FixJ family response regulator